MSAYLYLLYVRPGELAGVTLQTSADDGLALCEARRLLSEHAEVRQVEVYRDARLVAQAGA